MADVSSIAAGLGQFAPEQLRTTLENFLPAGATTAEKISAIEASLKSPVGQSMRETMARWIVDEIVPVERLVPETYLKWRPPVRDAMMFVVARLSPGRLAPKLLEQIELPPNTSAEVRLLRLIAKVPGLQKLGQVIARNQHLRPALRSALARLENGIRDVEPDEIRRIIERELGPKIDKYAIKIAPRLLSEASVSAVVRFSWHNPDTSRRQRGVFKVLKPHIPEYFAEDLDYLQGLAKYFGDRHNNYGFPADLLPDTFKKVRRLLQHEVNFVREQKTLMEAAVLYRSTPGVRIPQLMRPLCTPRVTALTEEAGSKVTSAAARLPASRRRKVAEQLIEALVAVPLFASTQEAIFHGDPHAGNLLYNNRTGELVILDWALRERLGRDQRRHLALLFLMVSLRDPVGASAEIMALSQHRIKPDSPRGRIVHQCVGDFLSDMPASHLPSAADAMRLLERVAMKGIRFEASLIVLSKVMFTLEGILGDIVGDKKEMSLAIARRVARLWLGNRSAFRSPLTAQDWFTLQCSALLYTSRLWVQWEQAMLNRFLRTSSAKAASVKAGSSGGNPTASPAAS
jgi:ubiquinone biosynthesis protein